MYNKGYYLHKTVEQLNIKFFLNSIKISLLMGLTLTVQADVELYKHTQGELSAALQLQTVGFTGTNSWFGNAQENIENNTNTWWEGTIEPSIKGHLTFFETQLYGQFSYLYGITVGHDTSGLMAGLDTPNKGMIEQGYIGWRSGNLISEQENLIDISLGRQDYRLGSGFLIYDGANDGGANAAWWIGARQSFDDTAVIRINWAPVKFDFFHLNTRPRNKNNKLGLNGINLEYHYNNLEMLAFSYITVSESQSASVKNLNVYDFRTHFIPFSQLADLQISGEYAFQENKQTRGQGGYTQLAYQHTPWFWQPRFIYRYTALQGDNPNTPRNEAFNELAYGFSDWGTWYQGEITGEHVFGWSNLNSHLLRVEMAPTENIVVNVMYYYFDFNRASALGTHVSNQHFADEFNLIIDWFATDNTLFSATFATAIPGKGGQQFSGGNKTWIQFMLYGSYTF